MKHKCDFWRGYWMGTLSMLIVALLIEFSMSTPNLIKNSSSTTNPMTRILEIRTEAQLKSDLSKSITEDVVKLRQDTKIRCSSKTATDLCEYKLWGIASDFNVARQLQELTRANIKILIVGLGEVLYPIWIGNDRTLYIDQNASMDKISSFLGLPKTKQITGGTPG